MPSVEKKAEVPFTPLPVAPDELTFAEMEKLAIGKISFK